MAKNNIAEVTLRFKADTTNISGTLSSLRKQISNLNINLMGDETFSNAFKNVESSVKSFTRLMSSGRGSAADINKEVENMVKAFADLKSVTSGKSGIVQLNYDSEENRKNLEKYSKILDQIEEKKRQIAKYDELQRTKESTGLVGTKGGAGQVGKDLAGDIEVLKRKKDEILQAERQATEEEQKQIEALEKKIVLADMYLKAQQEQRALGTKSGMQGELKGLEEQAAGIEVVKPEDISTFNIQIQSLIQNLDRLTTSYRNVGEEALRSGKEQQQAIKQQKENTKQMIGFGSSIFLGGGILTQTRRIYQQSINFFIEMDKTLTRITMVTGKARDEVDGLIKDYSRMATELNSTIQDVANVSLVFYQQGKTMNEAATLTDAAIKLQITGNLNATDAANRLTAAINGYKLAAQDAASVVDKLVAIDANAAASVDEMSTALSKVASQARLAGVELDSLYGYLATIQEVTREAPENIGTAMKSIIARFQEIKDLGKVEEDDTSFSKVAIALNKVGIAATDSQGQLRDLTSILDELGTKWNTLDGNTQKYLATIMAGNRQQSRFIALMDNYDRALELTEVSQNSTGESARQMRKYNESLQGSINRLKNEWQKFISSLTSSQQIKKIVDMVVKLVEVLNKVPSSITSIATIGISFNAISKIWGGLKSVFGDGTSYLEKFNKRLRDTGDIGKIVSKRIESIKNSYKNVETTTGETYNKITEQEEKLTSAQENGTVSTIQNTEAHTANALAKQNDAASSQVAIANNMKEKKTSDSVKEAKAEESKVVKDLTNANKQQTNSMIENDKPYSDETFQSLSRAKSLLASNQKLLEQAKSENSTKKTQLLTERNNARKTYETNVKNDSNLTKLALKKLKEERSGSGIKGRYSAKDIEDTKKLVAKSEGIKYNTENKRITALMNENKNFYQNTIKGFKEVVKENQTIVDKLQKKADNYYKKTQKKSDSIGRINLVPNTDINPKDNVTNRTVLTNYFSTKYKNTKESITDLFNKIKAPFNIDFVSSEEGMVKLKWADKLRMSIGKAGEEMTNLNEKFKIGQRIGKAFGSLMIGQMVSMGLEMVGLNEQTSSFIGNLVGFTKAGYDLGGPLGAGIGSVIAIAIAAWNDFDKAAEEAQKKADESIDTFSESSVAIKNLQSAVDSYNKLSKSINKTTEEQEELNNAIKELAEIAPEAVAGYDLQGNAIINSSKLDDAIEKKNKENAENAGKVMEDALINANAQAAKEVDTTGKKVTRAGAVTVASAAASAAAATAWSGPGAIIAAIVAGTVAWFGSKKVQQEIYRSEKAQALQKQLQEQSATITKAMVDLNAEAIRQGSEEGLSERENTAAYLIGGSYEKFSRDLINIEKNEGDLSNNEIKKLTNEYKTDISTAFDKLSKIGGLNKISNIVEDIQTRLDNGATWNEVSETVNRRLNSVFSQADISGDTLDKLTNGVISQIFSKGFNTKDLQEEIDNVLERLNAEGENKTTIKWIEKFKEDLNGLNQNQINILGNTGLLSDVEGNAHILADLKDELDSVDKASRTLDGTFNEGAATVNMISVLYKKMEDSLDQEEIRRYEDAIDSLYATLEKPVAPTFQEIADTVNDNLDTFNKLVDVIESLRESGGILDLENFTTLLSTLDGIEEAMYSNLNTMNMYGSAFNQLAENISYANGEIRLNEEGVTSLAEIQRLAFLAKVQQMQAEVDMAIKEKEMEKQLLIAERDALIEGLKMNGSAAETEQAIKDALNKNLNRLDINWLDSEAKIMSNYVLLNKKAVTQVASVWAKLENARLTNNYSGLDFSEETAENIKNGLTGSFVNTVMESLDLQNQDRDAINDILRKNITALNNSIRLSNNELEILYSKKNLLAGIAHVAESGYDALSKFSKGNADAADEYNEKLERTLTLLEKIEGLQHKIDENDTFKDLYDGYDGEKAAKYLLKNLDLAEEQMEVYKQLFDMQQEMTNQAAGDLLDSPYGDLFKISENGDIGWSTDNAYNIYKNLPDDMQEDIDELVESYQKERDALRDTENELTKYAQRYRDAMEEIVEVRREAEDLILEAVKNREQILHDARVKALDDEIAMIEKAREARQKAQEDRDDEKQLQQSQEALRRAMLDTSGKNNAQLLQLQQDLEDKQLEIAEKRFDRDLDARIDWLNDSKDAEDETFEYRLEKMTWYWEEVHAIQEAGYDEQMQFLMTWNAEYNQQSELGQQELRRQWQNTFDKLKVFTEEGKTDLQGMIDKFTSVTASVESVDIKVQALAGTWRKATDAVNNYSSAVGRIPSGGGGGNVNLEDGIVEPPLEEGDKTGNYSENKTPEYVVIPKKGAQLYDAKGKPVGNTLYKYQLPIEGTAKNGVGKFTTVQNNLLGTLYKLKDGTYIKKSDIQELNDNANKVCLIKYKTGGIVDYTGPAWVDGTKSKPEAFLNPYQTKSIASLASALDTNSVSNITGGNITIEGISFNVESMSSPDDGRKALDAFTVGVNDLMAKRGIGTTLSKR